MLNYPLRFEPILKEKIWGGNKLRKVLHKNSENENIGESWEISGVENNISVVENGLLKGSSLKGLLLKYKDKLVGEKVYQKFDSEFPLLIKFIDAKTDLSVQLHPDDKIARNRHNSSGKTEMWYILRADEGARINIGFSRKISKKEYLEHLESGTITKLLHFEEVKEGDAFFIEPGRVHAIGGGVLLAEVQQTSDVTYRIYDWDRVDEKGIPRELHTELALDAIKFDQKSDFKLDFARNLNQASRILECKYFTTNFLPVAGTITRDNTSLDSFVIYMCVKGLAEVSVNGNSESIAMGQTLLIPAENKKVNISSEAADLLEIYVS
ncbi:type I phosphomannose isomerase catalytic subunit [Salinimicrobium flavum]|uniref:Phosphohexomutase n=1 Tax=Salinimicrobium flavum TaxID=1737065 RepID=A0ABW5IZG3_9FLAO